MNELMANLNKLGREISDGQNKLPEVLKIIKSSVLDNEDIALTASFQNTELIGSFHFKSHNPMDVNEAFELLRLIAKVCTVYLRKFSSEFDYYVLQEIYYTLNFISEELFVEPLYKNITIDYSIKDREYHYQVSLYKYEFALLEKIRSLLINMFYKKDSDEKMSFADQDKALDIALKRIAKDKLSYINLNSLFLNTIRKGNLFNYLRLLRNRMVHGYLNPEKKKNFNLDIYLLFILIFYTFSELVTNIKTDDELVDVYQKANHQVK